MISDPIRSRVAAGAARFDEVRPRWPHRIDLETLDVQSGDACPLSQVFRSFARVVVAVFEPEKVAKGRYRGVDIRQIAGLGYAADPDGGDEYPALNAAWADEVRKRKEVL